MRRILAALAPALEAFPARALSKLSSTPSAVGDIIQGNSNTIDTVAIKSNQK
jgi:hypothetical protein